MPITEGAAAILSSAASAGISSGLSVAGGLFGKKKAKKANLELQQDQFEKNMAMAKWQNHMNRENANWVYEKNLEQWNRENEYNSPAAQMQRYESAGLNPNLMYSSAGSNTAASSPTMSEIEQNGYPMSGGSGVGDSMPSIVIPNFYKEYMDLKTQKMQQDSIQQNIDLQKAQMDAFKAQAFLNNLKGFQLQSSQPFWSKNAEYDNLGKKMAIDLKKQQFDNLVFNNTELNPLKKVILTLQSELQRQNYHFQESANPLKLLAMKLANNKMSLENKSISLDNDFKTDRNKYSDQSFLYDLLIKQNINTDKDINNELNQKIKKLIQTPTGSWSAGDMESFLLNLIRGIVF